MNRFFQVLEWFIPSSLVYPLRCFSGGSVRALARRIGRLRKTAVSIVQPDLTPPVPLRMQVETTDICNFKCRMCQREIIDGMNTSSMPLEKFIDVVEEVKPYFMGMNGLGEPLIDKTIFDKLAYLHKQHITTSMPTNGSYFRAGALDKLAEHSPDILTFSIDGATAQSFEQVRVNSHFDQVMENYRAIVEKKRQGHIRPGATIRILCAFQKANLYDYRAMFEIVQSLDCLNDFSLVPVMDYDPEAGTFSDLVPTLTDVLLLQQELDHAIREAVSAEERAFYQYWKDSASCWLEEDEQAPLRPEENRHACLVPWFNSYIDAKGRVYPCCELPVTEHVMGNIYEQSFEEIWSGPKYQEFRSQIMTDRPHLEGCKFCPRNDDKRLGQLEKLRPLLGIPLGSAATGLIPAKNPEAIRTPS